VSFVLLTRGRAGADPSIEAIEGHCQPVSSDWLKKLDGGVDFSENFRPRRGFCLLLWLLFWAYFLSF